MNIRNLVLAIPAKCLPGLILIALAGYDGAIDVPSGMNHPADPKAAAAKIPHDGPMQPGAKHRSMMSEDGHDISSMDMSSMDHGDHDSGNQMADGEMMPGDQIARLPEGMDLDRPAETGVERVIEVTAVDVGFEPKSITVRAGEIIRFVVTNSGAVDHEFMLGDDATQVAHAEEMANLGSNMDHGHLNALALKPGETKELVWTVEAGQQLQFACHVPGHYDAGMWGTIEIHL